MNGMQYLIIRLSRKISAKTIGNRLNFKSKTPVANIVWLETVPNIFIKALEEISGIDLSNEEQIEKLAIESVEQLTKLDYRNSIWKSKYSKFLKLNKIKGEES